MKVQECHTCCKSAIPFLGWATIRVLTEKPGSLLRGALRDAHHSLTANKCTQEEGKGGGRKGLEREGERNGKTKEGGEGEKFGRKTKERLRLCETQRT